MGMKMSYIAMTVLVFLTVSLPMAQTLFINKILGPDTQMQGNCEATGVGKCMFDLSCRLSYGQNVGECGGFYQVCCALPNSVGLPDRREYWWFLTRSGERLLLLSS